MLKLKAFFGYTLAALGVPVILVMLFGMGDWMNLLVNATGVQISPWETGGAIAYQIDRSGYHLDVHEPVFMALIGEKRTGFVQVDWQPLTGVPGQIDEAVDYDRDGTADFQVSWDWKTPGSQAQLTALQPEVLGVRQNFTLDGAPILRVNLRNSK
jgi:hypothetical protein